MRTVVTRRWLIQITRSKLFELARIAIGVGDGPQQVAAADDVINILRSSEHLRRAARSDDRPAQVAGLRTSGQAQHVHIVLENKQRVVFRQRGNGRGGEAKVIFSRQVAGLTVASVAIEGFPAEEDAAL